MSYDIEQPKTARERTKYIALDNGLSGCFLVDKETEMVYTVKTYGVPNHFCGTLDGLIESYSNGISKSRIETFSCDELNKAMEQVIA